MPTPPTKKPTKKPVKRNKKKASKEPAKDLIPLYGTVDDLDPFSGTHGCDRCGFDGPLISRFMIDAAHERPGGAMLHISGEHLMRACQWCQRSWLERCKKDSPEVETLAHQMNAPSSILRPIDPETPVYG